MGEKKSRTEKVKSWDEQLFGGSHHRTTLSDGKHKVEGHGSTSEKSQKAAKDKWYKK